MKKRLSIIILAVEISGIILLHAVRLSNQQKNNKASKSDVASQEAKSTHNYLFLSTK